MVMYWVVRKSLRCLPAFLIEYKEKDIDGLTVARDKPEKVIASEVENLWDSSADLKTSQECGSGCSLQPGAELQFF